MMDCKTRKPIAAALVAMLLAGGYTGAARADDAATKPPEEKKSPMEVLYDKLVKGFYGSMDVSVDFATKGMSGMLAYGGYGWNNTVPGGSFNNGTGLSLKNANCPSATGSVCGPSPVGNVGWQPQLSTNKSGMGFRGDHALPPAYGDLKVIYQVEASFSVTSAPGVSTSYTAQSNVVKSGLGFGDSYLGLGSKKYGNFKLGTLYAPYKKATDRMNPFSGQLGDYAVVMGNSGGDNRVEFGTRLNNSIAYESPKMYGGLSFDVTVAPGQNRTYDAVVQSSGSPDCNGGNIPGSGNLPANCDDGGFTSAFSLDLKYEQKNFYLVGAYERHNNVNRNSDGIGSNNPQYGYYYNNFGTALVPGNPLYLDMTPVAVAPANGGTVAPCGTSTCVTTIPLGAYTTDVGTEWAAKVGAQYIFDFGLTVSGVWESLKRNVPAYLQFQNERTRLGHWLALSQQLGESTQVSAGWAHAGATPGDPGGQHNFNPTIGTDTADMITLAIKEKIDKQVYVYLDMAETFNHGNAHYDLGAGGRGITTDCHDGTHASQIDYSSYGPTTWGGCRPKGVSIGMDYKF